MTSLPHLEDLPVDKALELLNSEFITWPKFDGSYLKFGIDQNGVFYTERKNKQRYHKIEDWPLEGWANSYRFGHKMSESIVLCILENTPNFKDFYIEAEILYGKRSNTTLNFFPNTLSIFNVSKNIENIIYDFGFDRYISFSIDLLTFNQNFNVIQHRTIMNGRVLDYHDGIDYHTIEMLNGFDNVSIKNIKDLLDIKFMNISNYEIYKIKANICPVYLTKEEWKENKKQIISQRDFLRKETKRMLFEIKFQLYSNLLRVLYTDEDEFQEGFVITNSSGITAKIVYQDVFLKMNNFTHIIKYWLVGGRRPSRPSFLSRTKDWPLDKRLERLNVLKNRFLKHRKSLDRDFEIKHGNQFVIKQNISYEDPDLLERTILLFNDVKERLINGR